MTDILAIAPNAASFSSADQVRNASNNIIDDSKNKFFYPSENAIAACVPQSAWQDGASFYALPKAKPTVAIDTRIGDFFRKSKEDSAVRLERLPADLQQRVQQQLSMTSLALIDRDGIVCSERVQHRPLAQACLDDYLALSEQLSRGKFMGGDTASNMVLLVRSETLRSGVRRMQDRRSDTEIDSSLTDALATLRSLTTSSALMQPNAGDDALLESTLGELGHSLIAMQDRNCLPDLDCLLAADAAFSRLNASMLKREGKIDPSLSQVCMEAQRIVAWTKLQIAAQQVNAESSATGQDAKLHDYLSNAMSIEAGIAAAATATLQAQTGSFEVDPLTELDLKAKLVHFLQVHDRFSATMRTDSATHSVNNGLISQNAGRQLNEWRKGADIGAEIMRLFITVLIRMREGMRESRQFALELYSQHADAAMTALKQQADDTWTKEILSAVGQIVSGAMQMAPIAVKAIHTKWNARKDTFGTHVHFSKAKTVPVNKNMQSVLKGDSSLGRSGKNRGGPNAENAKKIEGASVPKEKSATELMREEGEQNLKAAQLQQKIAYTRAAGELAQGAFGIAAAYYGYYAACDGVRHFSENAEMQKQIFQRDRWDKELDAKTHDIDQVGAIISDLQTRKTDTTKRLIG